MTRLGSIPASAGEPRPPRWRRKRERVYPRECGGTASLHRWTPPGQGLSPRVRGNRAGRRAPSRGRGSIPASAGEPSRCRPRGADRRVYPRECGGTRHRLPRAARRPGLSPRVRGNPPLERPRPSARGSIPASAGEPRPGAGAAARWRVYPRECGGTRICATVHPAREGLSPRVRGNLGEDLSQRELLGSIPASAGEPDSGRRSCWPRRVYPRECGGTRVARAGDGQREGLSPRVRGNPRGLGAAGPALGSIPASAGEPCMWRRIGRPSGVYPRECGGTARRATRRA